MNPQKAIPAVLVSVFLFIAPSKAQVSDTPDTIYLKIADMRIHPCSKGNNTVSLSARNSSGDSLVFAVHIQSNIRLASSIGRGWGMAFFDTIPPGEDRRIEHSFPFYSDVSEGVTLRLQYYQLRMSDQWDFQNHFFSRTYDHIEIAGICQVEYANVEVPEANIVDEFKQIQDLLREEKYMEVWNRFTKSHQEAKFQGDFNGFSGNVSREQNIDYWTESQFLQLIPEESLKLEDGRILLNATLNSLPWNIYFRYSDGTWKIDWIEGFTSLVDLWMTWQERLILQMQKESTTHFDFYYYEGSYAEAAIKDIVQTREEGYEKICQFLDLKTDQRISTFFFNDLSSKAIETGHRGKGAAFDTTIIEVYSEEIQAHPYHETVHILTRTLGAPPALFNEGLAEYLEIALSGRDSTDLYAELHGKIKELRSSADWIPITELITFTDIPGNSPAHVSYPEAAAFVKFLLDRYGKESFVETFRELTNSDQGSIQNENMDRLETIYGKPLGILIDEFHQFYLQ